MVKNYFSWFFRRHRSQRNERGFTLIELLVVVAIIAVLAALVLAALSSAQKGGRDSKRRSDLNQYKTALVQYRSDGAAAYPDPNCSNQINATSCQPYATLQPRYMQATLLRDPTAGRNYFYYVGGLSSSGAFVLCGQLERSGRWLRVGPTLVQEAASCGYVE